MTKMTVPSWIAKLALIWVACCIPSCAVTEQPSPPNILFIAVDDLKPMLNVYGETHIASPHIDRLAERGTVFLNNHCQQAVCGPSRASLMTGLRPDHTGVRDLKTRMRDVRPDILTLPQYLREHGYTTAAFGKIYDPRCVGPNYDSLSWTIPYRPNQDLPVPGGIVPPVFGHYQDPATRAAGEKLMREAEENGLEGYDIVRYGLSRLKPVVERADVPDNAYYDGIMVEAAMDQLTELAGQDEPFFLGVGFKKPHLPFVAPEKYWKLYSPGQIRLAAYREHSKNGPEVAYHKSGELRSYTGFEFVNDRIPEDQQREIIHGYYATVSYVDALIGNLISRLDELGLSDNTLIVLWGDHGWHLGDHNMWCKHSNFEQATRSPMILCAPGEQAVKKTASPTEFIDIFPTLCDLAGLEIPGHLDGTSLLPLMEGSGGHSQEFAISQFHRGKNIMGYSMRTRRYRYTEWHDRAYLSTDTYRPENIVGRELYDYQADPWETVNYAEEPAYGEVLAGLSARMKEFLVSQEISEEPGISNQSSMEIK